MSVGLLVAVLPSMSGACASPSRYGDFADQVNNNLDWLLCLHNVQVASLNDQAAMLNGLSDDLYLLRTAYLGLNTDFTALSQNRGETVFEQELLQQFIDIAAENILLRLELTNIYNRLNALEAQLAVQ